MQVTRTYLELKDRYQLTASFGDFPGVRIACATRPQPALYRLCYRTVGEAFHWRDRWDWTDQQIADHLTDPAIQLFVATRQSGTKQADLAGWYELRRVPEDDSVEIAYFGIVAAEFGRGLGKHLLSSAVQAAWALGPKRVWLHTCTLDHPNALPNYLARGFMPYRTETYEVDSAFVNFNWKFQLTRKHKLIIAGILLTPVLIFALYTWSALNWSYSEGERAGFVQKFSKRGWLCKSWEGELAMVSMPGTNPEKFLFTVRDDAVAEHINQSLGQRVAITYQQHKGIPTTCFGETEYFVVAVKVLQQ